MLFLLLLCWHVNFALQSFIWLTIFMIHLLKFILFDKFGCFAWICICLPGACEDQKRDSTSTNWSCIWLWTTMQVLEFKPRFTWRVASVLDHWTIYPAPQLLTYLWLIIRDKANLIMVSDHVDTSFYLTFKYCISSPFNQDIDLQLIIIKHCFVIHLYRQSLQRNS